MGDRTATNGLLWAGAAALLLWAAIANGFPLVFPDSGVYLRAADERLWAIDRSPFYGLFLWPLLALIPGIAGLWAAVAVQALLVAAILLLAVRRLAPDAPPVPVAALLVGIAAATSLPWHAGQIMPDAFTGALVLLVWAASARDPAAPGTPSLWFAAAAAALIHLSHFALLGAAAAAALAARAALGLDTKAIVRRALAASLALAFVAAAMIGANGLVIGRWSLAPAGPVFLFARMNEDGLIAPWISRQCASGSSTPLCRQAPSLPRDSQQLLWSPASPVYRHVWLGDAPARRHWIDAMETAAFGAIARDPIGFALALGRGAGAQLVRFAPLDDLCPARCAERGGIVERALAPRGAVPAFHRSLQARGETPKAAMRLLIVPVASAAMLAMLPLGLAAWRRRDEEMLALLAAIAAGLVVNALITGGLSDVNDRYQSRIAWLAPFAVMLAWLRAQSRHPATNASASAAGGRGWGPLSWKP